MNPQPISGYELHPKVRKAFVYIFGVCCLVSLVSVWLDLPRYILDLFSQLAIVIMCFAASIKFKFWIPVPALDDGHQHFFDDPDGSMKNTLEENVTIKMPFSCNDTGYNGEIMKTSHMTAEDLKPVFIFDNTLSESQKDSIRFELYLNGNKGSRYATYWDFCEFLDMYGIDRSSVNAALVEAGVPIETPDGVANFVRVSPSDEIVLAATKIPDLHEFFSSAKSR